MCGTDNVNRQKNLRLSVSRRRTPCMDDHQVVGALAFVYVQSVKFAGIGRLDKMWTVNTFSRAVTKWNRACDQRLAILISYIQATMDHGQFRHVGDKVGNCKLCAFQNASFVGDLKDSKSTSGGVLCMFGDRTQHQFLTAAQLHR